MNNLALGWQLMGYGLAGVFTTLLAFILVIKLIIKLFPEKKEEDNTGGK